jgi:hypothetical protein
MLADIGLLCSVAVLADVICCAALELQNGSNFEMLLKEATECYKMGDYNRALALCQPVSMGEDDARTAVGRSKQQHGGPLSAKQRFRRTAEMSACRR